EAAAGARDGRPFFLWCSFPDPHHPYACPLPWAEMYDPEDMPPPNRREGELDALPPFFREVYETGIAPSLSGLRGPAKAWDPWIGHLAAMTYGMVSAVDHHLGRILEALAALGLREKTLVVFMSDHGDMMGDHWLVRKGPFHFEGLLRI